jgi:hypothetical protein
MREGSSAFSGYGKRNAWRYSPGIAANGVIEIRCERKSNHETILHFISDQFPQTWLSRSPGRDPAGDHSGVRDGIFRSISTRGGISQFSSIYQRGHHDQNESGALGPCDRGISHFQAGVLQHPQPYRHDHGVGRNGGVPWILQCQLFGEDSVQSNKSNPAKRFLDLHLVLMEPLSPHDLSNEPLKMSIACVFPLPLRGILSESFLAVLHTADRRAPWR